MSKSTSHHVLVLLFSIAVSCCCFVSTTRAADWPQWRGEHRDGTWSESGLVKAFAAPVTEPLWSVPVSSGYSQPTVAHGRVFLTDRLEEKDQERVHCFNANTGKVLWQHVYDADYKKIGYDAGPRAAVIVQDGLAYSLGTMGHLFCLDATSGKVIWSHNLYTQYDVQMPVWGLSASPLIEGDLIIVEAAGRGATLVAFDRKTGREVWASLDSKANYSSPIVIDQAGQRVLVLWVHGSVLGVDPANGKLLWEVDYASTKMPLGVATPILHGDYLFFTGFYDGSLLVKLNQDKPSSRKVWRRKGDSERKTDGLHSIISTPLVLGDYIFGVDSYGELRCLELMTGDRVWEDKTAVPEGRWATIHFVQNGANTWMLNEQGDLIIAELSKQGFKEISRTRVIETTKRQSPGRRNVCWAAPAYADRKLYVRNDQKLVCIDLAE